MKRSIGSIIVAGALCSLGFRSQPATPSSKPENSGKAPALKLSDLNPSARPFVIKRAKHCFKMPDGRICDASQYYELKDAIDKSLKRVTEYGVPRLNSSPLAKPPETGHHWELDRSDLAEAWCLIAVFSGGVDAATGEMVISPSNEVNMQPSSRLKFDPAIRPLLKFELPSSMMDAGVIFVDDIARDRYSEDQNIYRTFLKSQPSETIVKVDGRPMQQEAMRNECVAIPDAKAIDKGHLVGKFVLIPDPTIVHPEKDTKVNSTGSKATVLRYVSVQRATVKPEELAEAVVAGRLRLSQWKWKRGPGGIFWSEEQITIERSKNDPARSDTK